MARPGISTKNTEKIALGPKLTGTSRKYPKNPEKIPKMRIFGILGVFFSVFSGYFGGKFWESRISGRGVFFRYFSWKFRVGPSRGSVAGRGVLNRLCPFKDTWHHVHAWCTFFRCKCRIPMACASPFRGPKNGAFGEPCLCPAKRRGFLTKMAKMTNFRSNQ